MRCGCGWTNHQLIVIFNMEMNSYRTRFVILFISHDVIEIKDGRLFKFISNR